MYPPVIVHRQAQQNGRSRISRSIIVHMLFLSGAHNPDRLFFRASSGSANLVLMLCNVSIHLSLLLLLALAFSACDTENNSAVSGDFDPADLFDAGDNDADRDAPIEYPDVDCAKPSFKGAAMVQVQTPMGVKYCIDKTKVTKAEYLSFLHSAKFPSDLLKDHPRCAYLTHFNPEPLQSDSETYKPYPFKPSNAPMTSIDHCRAAAYCAWAGKRLCGSVGGGPMYYGISSSASKDAGVDITNSRDVEQSQWYNACTSGGRYEFSTGEKSPLELNCDTSADSTVLSLCPGPTAPFSSIYGMTSMLFEMEDMCGQSGCAFRGGPLNNEDNELRCDSETNEGVSLTNASFRCCAD